MNFSPINNIDFKTLDQLQDQLGAPYSDFNYYSLVSWDIDATASYALLDGGFVFKMRDYTSDRTICAYAGYRNVDSHINTLLARFPRIDLIPEATINKIGHTRQLRVTEDRDNADYIYRIKDLVELSGQSFAKIRNARSLAKRLFGKDIKIQSYALSDPEFQTIRKEILKRHFNWIEFDPEFNVDESRAIQRLLAIESEKLFVTVAIYHGGLIAFSINEVVGKYGVCHFEKAAPEYKKVYPLLVEGAAKLLMGRGCKYVNWEQDLGIDGLRTAKQRYRPAAYLKKYTVRRTG